MSENIINVDPSEIEKFSALAAKWWDPTSEFKPLHALNPLRLNWINNTVGSLQGKKVIDVGCGGGILAESIAQKGADVTGIDLAEKSLTVAKLHGLESNVKVNYQKISVEEMAATHAGQFDVVTCMEMLEHVPDPDSVIKACAQLVKPNGWVFFSTINRNAKSFALAIVAAEYLLKLLPKGTHNHSNFIKPSEMAASVRRSGLELQELIGMTYNPVSDHYALVSDISVNYLMATKKCVS